MRLAENSTATRWARRAPQAVLGYVTAIWLDVSIGGTMALWTGVFLLAAFLLGPRYGLLAQRTQRRRQQGENAARMLVVHLYNHENKAEAAQENNVSALRQHLRWDGTKVARVTAVSREQGLITLGAKQVEALFDRGRTAFGAGGVGAVATGVS